MCGIIGAVNLSSRQPMDARVLEAANNSMVHRGPDDAGTYLGDGVALAMRRLSIVDIHGGHQPMASDDGSVQLVYNGETFNHTQLRRQLEAHGHVFRTRSDTEVVLRAYEQWGTPGFLDRLRGQAALALWDGRTHTLLLARDRFGIKPLYYTVADGRLSFASEIRPLLVLTGRTAALDLEALGELMSVTFVSAPRTLFAGITKLPAAHYLEIRDGEIRQHRYWSIAHVEPREASLPEAAAGFADQLREAVDLRLMSDVPLGGLLSGGIDSATIAAMANASGPNPLTTVSIGFPEDRFDEADRARAAAEFIGTDHHAFSFPSAGMDRFPDMIRQLEEPIVSTAPLAGRFILETAARTGLTVVLGGDGADELLGGYRWHHWDRLARPLTRIPYQGRRLMAKAPWLGRSGRSRMGLATVLGARDVSLAARYRGWLALGAPQQLDQLITSDARPGVDAGVESMLGRWDGYAADARRLPPFEQLLWLESQTRMIDFSNHAHDRNSMAVSVEARVPFQDHLLWEYTMALPQAVKVRGMNGNRVEKVLLREAAAGLIPESTRQRRKLGLTGPHDRWLLQERLPDWAEELLSPAAVADGGVFVPAAVSRLRAEHQRGAPNRSRLLLGVLCVQTWLHEFVHSRSPAGS